MIQRKPSKINDSLVNSTHEDHLNVSKAIRDDAPITNLTTAVKSINFESDGDGAYVLRYPLVKKEAYKTSVTSYPFNFYLYDNVHKATCYSENNSTYLTIGNANLVLKYYDNDLNEQTRDLGTPANLDWLSIKSINNTLDATILNCVIDHKLFIQRFGYFNKETTYLDGSPFYFTSIKQALTNTSNSQSYEYDELNYQTLTKLKRFIKIYKDSEAQNLTFILEIVHPELNSITSGLDVGNASTLDINLLLDNPYAIRDLYSYGSFGTTKILPYIVKDESYQTVNSLGRAPIWSLTEQDFVPATEDTTLIKDNFRLLVSSNKNAFKNKFLILKAFITSGITNLDYYCCWEESSNNGTDWEVCQEFIDKFMLTDDDIKKVADLTSKQYSDTIYDEYIEKAKSHLVSKKLYHVASLKEKDFSQDDLIRERPDVLVLENPDLTKLYRFVIYVDTHQQTPDASVKNLFATKTNFSTPSGYIDDNNNIRYEIIQNSGSVPAVDAAHNLVLPEGPQDYPNPFDADSSDRFATISLGNSLHIYTENPLCTIKEIQYTLADASQDANTNDIDVGALLGVSNHIPTSEELNIPDSMKNPKRFTYFKNAYDILYLVYADVDIEKIYKLQASSSDAIHDFWKNAGATTLHIMEDSDNQNWYLTNIFNCLYTFDSNALPYDNYPAPFTESSKRWIFVPDIDIVQDESHTYANRSSYTLIERFNYKCEAILDDGTIRTLTTEFIERDSNPAFIPYNARGYDCYSVNGIEITRNQNNYRIRKITYYIKYSLPYTGATDKPQYQVVEAVSGPTVYNVKDFKLYPDGNRHLRFFEFGPDSDDIKNLNVRMNAENSYFKVINTDKSCVEYTYNYTPSNQTYFSKQAAYDALYKQKGISITNSTTQAIAKIKSITVSYSLTEDVSEIFTSTYLVSTTGSFQVAYSTETKTVEDLTSERDRIFDTTSKYYYNPTQAQLLIYKDNNVYISGTNSSIMKLMNSLSMPEKITKIIPWRSYLLLFSAKNIYLAKYDDSSDSYTTKVLSNTVGVDSIDADTIVPILNSVYFKSGNKIYKLVPNLYAASDDILNIHQISIGVNNILEDLTNTYIETHNFSYANADNYMVFIPIASESCTYCIHYDFNKQVWTLQKYPVYLTDIVTLSSTETYVTDGSVLYYFNNSMNSIIAQAFEDLEITNYDYKKCAQCIPYGDYLDKTPEEIAQAYISQTALEYTPIQFEIDFGQKSSNYTLDKQFLETKLILATLSNKDRFPLSLDIYTDGMPKILHIDANTDAALWKTAANDLGILNTSFGVSGQDYNGIFRQLIVKYSGKGKTIRHIVSGESTSLFKFYSMNVRARILPKKQ